MADLELSRAAKRLIITTEKLVGNHEIRLNPTRTCIPFYLVDAVIEVPYGSYPGNMAYEYFSDEDHLREWLRVEEDPEEFEEVPAIAIFTAFPHLKKNFGSMRWHGRDDGLTHTLRDQWVMIIKDF